MNVMKEIPTPAKVKVTRADLRNRKIILVLEPDLLSNEVFSPSPFYDDGDNKNKLQTIRIGITLLEEKGKVTIEKCNYVDYHSTTGHRQININEMFINKKDHAIYEILTTDYKYIEDKRRINQLLSNWDNEIEFRDKLINLINNRKEEHKKKEFIKALEAYETARKNLEHTMCLDDFFTMDKIDKKDLNDNVVNKII
jgi:hypothetical protein